jgi:uncharacterized protein (DUF1501 family)
MKRRQFLQTAALFSSGTLIPIGVNGWAWRGNAQIPKRQRTIVIFLRGAIDGLNVVVPYQEPEYYESRPNIALSQPQEKGGVLDLDGFFGLHPTLVDLLPLWKNKSLAFIHACGLPSQGRSHFDAQYYMETGTPGLKNTPDGWMNRLFATLPQDKPTQAISLGNDIPQILEGKMAVANVARGNNAKANLPIDISSVNTAFDRLYNGKDALSLAYQEGDKARQLILKDLQADMDASSQNAPSTTTFIQDARTLAKLMVGDSKTQLAFIDLGGWDTHISQNNILPKNLESLGQGLATLVKELGSLYGDTTIIVMSEFGRTVKENGNRGTDHGHGNVMWVLGGNVRGGQVYGKWPGLEEAELYQGRDLAITTDFRDAIASILKPQFGLSNAQLQQIFPNYKFTSLLNII